MQTSIFIPLFLKIIPLYMNIGMGYIAGKTLNAHRETIARLMLFMINPMIIFNGVLNVKLETNVLTLPLLTFGVGCALCLFFYKISKKIWEDSTKNLVAYSAGTGNVGYFGLPIALLLFDPEIEGIYILLLMGMTLYENTLGYYILAKGSHSARDCVQKVLRLPSLYAFIAALFLNFINFPIPTVFVDFMSHIKGTYTVLGMMVIGLGLAALPHLNIDRKFVGMTLAAKFIAWPILVLLFNLADTYLFGFYSSGIHKALLLIAIVPMGVNTVIVATILNSKPEKAAASLIISTLIAIVYVPLMVAFFINT
jgi:malate permease and related proteins